MPANAAWPFLDWPGPLAVRAPRRGQRGAREHDARVRARGRAGVPLPGDRRAPHGRRGARRLPRRPARSRHRRRRPDRGAAVVRRGAGQGGRTRAHPPLRGPARGVAGRADQRRPQARPRRRAPRRRAASHRCDGSGVRRGVQRQAHRAGAIPHGARALHVDGPAAGRCARVHVAWPAGEQPSGRAVRTAAAAPGADGAGDRAPRRRRPRPRHPGARVDDRRAGRDGAPARPGRGRHHDRPAPGAEGPARRAGQWFT